MHHYIALIHKDADSGYGISFSEVPGFTTVADALDEALREAGAVLGFAFEDWHGALPTPRSLDDLRKDESFREWSSEAVVAVVLPARGMAEAV